MTTTIRPLASSERGFVGPAPTTGGFELTLRGHLDLDALNTAFIAVRAAHPALDATIAADGDDFLFVAPEPGRGAMLTVDRAETLPDRSSAPLVDPTAATARLHVVTTGSRHRVTLSINHALADGTYLIAILREIWSRYTSVVDTGTAGDVAPHSFPASAQHVLDQITTGTDTGRERLDGIRWYGAAPTLPDDPAPLPRLPEVTSLLFSEEVTARFAAASAEVGFTALLSGVLLCAERAGFVDEAPETEISVGAMTLVDMRRRVSPALPPTGVTNFVGASFAAPRLTIASDPAAVGAAIFASLRDDLAAGRCLNVLASPTAPGPVEQPVVLSHMGRLTLELPDGLVGEALRTILAMDSAVLHVPTGPRTPSPSATVYPSLTFAGRLGIEVLTLGGTAPARSRAAVADRLVELVHAIAQLTPAA